MKEIEPDTGGLFLPHSKRKLVFQLRTGKGKGMAYQNVVYRIINTVTSNFNVYPLAIHKKKKNNKMTEVKFWSQSNKWQLCC